MRAVAIFAELWPRCRYRTLALHNWDASSPMACVVHRVTDCCESVIDRLSLIWWSRQGVQHSAPSAHFASLHWQDFSCQPAHKRTRSRCPVFPRRRAQWNVRYRERRLEVSLAHERITRSAWQALFEGEGDPTYLICSCEQLKGDVAQSFSIVRK